MHPKVLIAGAGIGGLTTALALHGRGIASTTLERTAVLRPLGAGINLLPHAVRELSDLGLGAALRDIAVAPDSIGFYADSGELLFREPRGHAAGDGHPQLSVHRGRLQMMLFDAVTDRLGASAVRTGAGVAGFDENADGVSVRTTAGTFTGDALIGADGIGSVVRRALHPGPDALLWSGITMFRGVARIPAFLDGHTMAIAQGANGIDLVTYPIGDGLVNWVLQVPEGTPGPLAGDAQWNAPATAAEIRRHVARWTLDWLDPAALIEATEQIFRYPMVDRDPLPHWGTGRVTLLGDAAHPMYPVGANGGSQSIVDARVLADEYAADGIAGLHRYARQRRGETAEVIAANRDMHRTSGRTPADLDRITTKYRNDTARSNR
ncbi:FAD-dependent monooxygenase [Mycolicibacterium bacteremicum]|uniref:Flavin-dependent oxidoreductase n=1 Tax=Mycolicibacterium bacteremicum TaxID=564198 RepID=A0A1W9YSI6_MYCBA|nr:FAD-dependent monooxygenase [Mycolicibacterium bacteremicum]MCV7430337.1 FAD-dependent monooxygenase [Mycolicibacterium bacteremicum]ORA02740.1 flavin-dependent oxidoreductase [Mycolicibacterium bacteremicum]